MSSAAKQTRAIRDGLFEGNGEDARLLGSRCVNCHETTFPVNQFCPQCCTETTEQVSLSRRGVLYSFTVQRFKPPPPYRGTAPFAPYGVGMIELPEGVRITSILEEADPDLLKVGMQMELVIASFFEDEDGNEVLGYKFAPVKDTEQSSTEATSSTEKPDSGK